MTNYPKYEINEEAEILGVTLLTLAESQNLYDFKDLVQKYGYDNVDSERWYSLQQTLNFLKELTTRHSSTQNMVSIGMKLFDVIPLPPEVQTVTQGLQMFNSMNQVIQRNVIPNRDWYEVKVINDRHIKFIDNGAYPHDLVYGEIYSLARRLKPEGLASIVTRNYMNSEDPDSSGAIYNIEFKD